MKLIEEVLSYLSPNIRILEKKGDSRKIILDLQSRVWLTCKEKNLFSFVNYMKNERDGKKDKLFSIFNRYKMLKRFDSTKQSLSYRVDINVTRRCNLQCPFCCVDAYPESVKEEWDSSLLASVIDATLNKLNIGSLRLTGGEPFIRDDIIEKLKNIRTSYKGILIIATNGTKLSQDICESLAELDCHFEISLDGPNETICDSMRGKGAFKKIITGIINLQNAGINNISASCILTHDSFPKRLEFKKLCTELGIKKHAYQQLVLEGRAKKNRTLYEKDALINLMEDMSPVDARHYHNTSKQSMRPAVSCGAGKNRLYIQGNGNVYPCSSLSYDKCCLGNISDQNWSLEFPSPEMKLFREWSIENHPICSECNVRYFCNNGCWSKNLLSRDEQSNGLDFLDYIRPDCKLKKQALQNILWPCEN